jgi:DNA primase
VDLDNLDVEQLVSYLGYDYRVSNGNSGVQLNLRSCPACHRQDFKVYVNADSGLGNCFQCNVGLNRYKLIKLTLGLASHQDVVKYVKTVSPSVSYKPKVHPDAYKLNSDWVLPINRKIELEEDVPEYLRSRGIDAKLSKRFDLRICEAGFYKYKDFTDRNRFVDFSNRILLPVHDITGNLVTFQGRDITGESEKKYLFPNMLPGTARFIYNAHYALKNKASKIVLSEGCFDVFATTTALESDVAFKDFAACGTFGKHLSISSTNVNTADQLTDLFRLAEEGVEEFIVLWDGEPEAIKAAIVAALSLQGYGLNATVARLSDGQDPAEAGTDKILSALAERRKPSKLDLIRMRLLANECL